ncbi:hypothetical protein BCR36DRAFT_306416 [Piromyces finnis]|uniref:Uncharacterized protein n=1 Tax=Piromyces finnis TaxID=1754191 RepID=A0A1Y1UWV7_9FUNG|nr:hypothetical protein BCR36DRAFT_306416 [Piromyces finnis]|eukprot:ORX42607.1 hypothetical protein BCR36DRAFT_306416 [Piromyces finnis]
MYDRSQFIENGTYASNWEWLKSKGTSYQCYLDYIKIEKGQEEQIGETVNSIRIIIYALSRPFSFVFFYWTLLVFFLHKFNFKKPVMKILLIHIILR